MKIAIAGYGIEGEQNFAYWNKPENDITILDEKDVPGKPLPEGVRTILGDGAYDNLSEYDIVIRTAGLPPRKLASAKNVWSGTNEFFEKCMSPIIGVTGTKGKGTTSSLIASILRAAGKTVHLVGNIGVPAISELSKVQPDDIVVYELSSFQLWDLKKSPHVAVVLMIEPDHLDVHEDMHDYVGAKANIVRHQKSEDVLVFNSINELSRNIASQGIAQKIEYPFEINDLLAEFKLPGKHNKENASAAVAATSEYLQDAEMITQGLGAFSGLPHRLKFVAEKNGVSYYDDSIATTPGSAIAAINSFADKQRLLILGGHDKGSDYTELRKMCHEQSVKGLAIGSNREKIVKMCDETGVEYEIEAGNMSAIVAHAAAIQTSGVVLLSPAAASFDMFKGYGDRGDQFVAAVQSL